MHKTFSFLAFILLFLHTGCTQAQIKHEDSSTVNLPEVTIQRDKKEGIIGLSNIKPETGFRGGSGDKIAVYIANPSDESNYFIEGATLVVDDPKNYNQGYLSVYICDVTGLDNHPGERLSNQVADIHINNKKLPKKNKLVVRFSEEISVPKNGFYVVIEWHYERKNDDIINHKTRSITLAGNLSLDKSYTWSSVGDLKNTWQREGEIHSLSNILFHNKKFNALISANIRGN